MTPTSIAHIPLLILLASAAAVCLLLVGELRGRLMTMPRSTPRRQRIAAGLGGLLTLVLASAVLFLIAGFIGFGFGPYYLVLSGATVLVVIVLALRVERISRIVERMTTGQLTLRATAVIGAFLLLAVLYAFAANQFGLTLQVGRISG